MSSTVLVVDDHPIVRHGIVALLRTESWVERVMQAATCADGARLAVLERPTLAIVDLRLPDGDGNDLVRTLRRTVPACRVLVLTHEHDEKKVHEALAAGAKGYVVKETDPAAVLTAVKAVADGGTVLGPDVVSLALGSPAGSRQRPPLDRLTSAQLRILAGLGAGHGTPRIAADLGLSDKTIRNRIAEMLLTLDVTDRVQAALLAREHGLRPEDLD